MKVKKIGEELFLLSKIHHQAEINDGK